MNRSDAALSEKQEVRLDECLAVWVAATRLDPADAERIRCEVLGIQVECDYAWWQELMQSIGLWGETEDEPGFLAKALQKSLSVGMPPGAMPYLPVLTGAAG